MKSFITALLLFPSLFLFGQSQQFNCSRFSDTLKIEANGIKVEDINNLNRQIDLKPIQSTQSDVEIRFYSKPSLVYGGTVIIISCKNGKMKANRIVSIGNRDGDDETKINYTSKTAKLRPAEGWSTFFETLQNLDFFSLPTMDEIRPKMKKEYTNSNGEIREAKTLVLDGVLYTFEIKVRDRIRTFSYHSPESYYKNYINVIELQKATLIIRAFEKDLM
tara:strand:- start:509 stop:1165 length:657 start_codon:yes stop_codon:yes gene_type:complete